MHLSFPRLAIWGGLAAVIIGFFVYSFSPSAVPVDIATLERGRMTVTVSGDGVTRIKDVYEITAPVSGKTRRSPVQVGDTVEGGVTVVAIIQPAAPAFLDARARSQAEAAVQEAEASLHVADASVAKEQADLAYAENQFNRISQLAERGTVSVAQLDDARLKLRVQQTALDAAISQRNRYESALERTKASLLGPDAVYDETADSECCVEIVAPISGTVLAVTNESARQVQLVEPLLSIGQLDDLEIVVDLLSSDAVRIRKGARAEVRGWGGENMLEAVVRRVEPSAFKKISALGIEEQRVRVLLDITSSPSSHPSLGNEYYVLVDVEEWERDDVLKLPISALFRQGGDWAVFTVSDNSAAKLTKVSIGHRNNTVAEVLGGLDPKDRVILHPGEGVRDGVAVIERK